MKEAKNVNSYSSGWSYRVISEQLYNKEMGDYQSYGVRVTGPDYEDVIHDVSLYEDVVARMTEYFNRHQLSPVHMRDAVEDMLLIFK